jgi:hypothetical protein
MITPCLLIKDASSTFTVEVEAFSNQTTRNVYVVLLAFYNGVHYMYDAYNTAWVVYELPYEVPLGLHLQPLPSTFDFGTFEGIETPPAVPVGDHYFLSAFIYTGNTAETVDGKATYITGLKIFLKNTNINIPRKLTETTSLSTSRRKAVEFESKFYNLPEIDGNTAIYSNGILATNLDHNVGDSNEELYSDLIIAPPTFKYRDNIATLLVHLSDMIGINHVLDRWQFDADITRQTDEFETLVPALDTKTPSGATSSTIDDTGAEYIEGWDEVTAYGMQYRPESTASWTAVEVEAALSRNEFEQSITGLTTGTVYIYRSYIKIGAVYYYGQMKSATTL